MSERILTGLGVRRRAIVLRSSCLVSSSMSMPSKTVGASLWARNRAHQ